ncbi:THO complex subunit 3 [Haematococcus lacustris]|uniref:THO complex subunit 3 n=1 Tax=Haematococcus lacustris TaxID=44745 RepID=A0A6A0AFN5_HAELA|nr:THO complex subunit 3 [Haematococcus lacustris]
MITSIWDVRSGKCSHMLSTSCGNTYLAWSPDGNSFATKNENDVLTLYDFRKMRAAKHPYKCVGQGFT